MIAPTEMGKKNANNHALSKFSDTSLRSSPRPKNIPDASVLLCAFLHPQFLYPLFVSVVNEIDSQHVRIHDTHSQRVLCSHSTGSTASVTCLDWGKYRSNSREEFLEPSRKKRKIYTNPEDRTPPGDGVVVAYGTDASKIQLLSPVEGKVVAILEGVHTLGIKDFKFSLFDDCQSGWSLGGDGKLVQWDVQKAVSIKSIPITNAFATTLLPTRTRIFYASHAVHGVDLVDFEQKVKFGASTTNVHTMLFSASEASAESPKLLTAAYANPQMQIFDVFSAKILATLVARNDIKALSYLPGIPVINDDGSRKQADLLAAVTVDNTIEIFTDPFKCTSSPKAKHLPKLDSESKYRVNRSLAVVQLHKPTGARALVPILKVCLQGNTLVIAWLDDGINICFEEIQCIDSKSGEVLLSGLISKPVSGSGGLANYDNSSTRAVQSEKRVNVDESHAVVLHGRQAEQSQESGHQMEVIDISSALEESSSSDGETNNIQSSLHPQFSGQHDASSGARIEYSKTKKDIEDYESLSFGELMVANAPETVAATAASSKNKVAALVPLEDRNYEPANNLTFATLLPQALGTNDNGLLERCLHVADMNMIRATVERLNPTLATALLEKLADRLHSRPGRAGILLVWIQWTLIAHGGYLGTQTAIVKKLNALQRVVRERANTLQPLLSLKGKLDMLEAQMNMRKSMQQRLGNRMIEDQTKERAAVHVEGQNETSSDDDNTYKLRNLDGEVMNVKGLALVNITNGTPGMRQASDDSTSDDREFEQESGINESDHAFDQAASESEQGTGESLDEEVGYDDIDSFEEEEKSVGEELPGSGKLKSGMPNGIGSKRA